MAIGDRRASGDDLAPACHHVIQKADHDGQLSFSDLQLVPFDGRKPAGLSGRVVEDVTDLGQAEPEPLGPPNEVDPTNGLVAEPAFAPTRSTALITPISS